MMNMMIKMQQERNNGSVNVNSYLFYAKVAVGVVTVGMAAYAIIYRYYGGKDLLRRIRGTN